MAEAEKRIAARGHDVSMMGVEVENDRARKLYERPGDKAFERTTESWLAEDLDGRQVTHAADVILMKKHVGH